MAQRLNGDFRLDHRSRIPRTVWALGIVSLFMDLSSESIHALLPLFLTTTLMAKLVVDRAPPELRGSAFGMFNLAAGVAMLFASVLAGLLWDNRNKYEPEKRAALEAWDARLAELLERVAPPTSVELS